MKFAISSTLISRTSRPLNVSFARFTVDWYEPTVEGFRSRSESHRSAHSLKPIVDSVLGLVKWRGQPEAVAMLPRREIGSASDPLAAGRAVRPVRQMQSDG